MEPGYTFDQAMREAGRCLLCHDAPCSAGCPAGTDPGAFVRKMRLRNIKGAIRTVKQNNIFGGVCAVLCPTKRLCEEKCTATQIESPINIGRLQRFLVEYGWHIRFNPLEKAELSGGKVAVIGAGPSGLACAAELAKSGLGAVVFEAKGEPGGVLRHLLPAHRMPARFLDKEIEEIKNLGVEIKCNATVEGKEGIKNLFAKGFRAVYIASGTWKPLRLEIEGRDLDGITTALELLESKDAYLDKIKGKNVMVVGGGDAAMDVAETVKMAGGSEVYLVYRRSFNQMPADLERRQAALACGAHFLVLTQPVRYLGDSGKVAGVKVVRNVLGEKDESGRPRPVAAAGSEHTLDADFVVEALGFEPLETGASLFSDLDLTKSNLIVVDGETGRTSMEKVFAGGDAVRGPSLVVNAVADGKRAAAKIIEIGHGSNQGNTSKCL